MKHFVDFNPNWVKIDQKMSHRGHQKNKSKAENSVISKHMDIEFPVSFHLLTTDTHCYYQQSL